MMQSGPRHAAGVLPRRMILITGLDVWMLTDRITQPGTGNQDLYNTLIGYARAGWDVHMLTPSRTCADMPSIHERVTIHRAPIQAYDVFAGAKRKVSRVLSRHGAEEYPTASYLAPPAGLYPYSRLFRLVMGRRAIELARRLGDVAFIYGHEIHGAVAGEMAARTLGVPLITRFQGTELCRFLQAPEQMRRWKAHVSAATVNADLVIMADDGTEGDRVLDMLGVPCDRVRFWMNGVVKADVYRPHVNRTAIRAELGLADGQVMILHTGRMFHWKRIDRHLRVLRLARDSFEGFKAVFIGDGPELAAMRLLCRDLRLEDRVVFLGPMSHDEVMNYLNTSDIYISFYDLSNLSNSLIESCICGKCVVTTNIGGTVHLLEPGVNAVVVPAPDDDAAIAEGLLGVLQNPAERERLARGAFARGKELDTWDERMAHETAEVAALLDRRSRSEHHVVKPPTLRQEVHSR